jgi:hypothetical protein
LSKRSLCDKPNGRLYLLGVNERLFAFRGERNDSFTVMSVRRDELPNVDDIRCLADVNLPLHYVIKEVRVSRGPDTLIGAANDFEVVIEYENRIGEGLIGSFGDIEAYQHWAGPSLDNGRAAILAAPLSGRRDSNPRPLEPHSSALPSCATARLTRKPKMRSPPENASRKSCGARHEFRRRK